MTGRRRSTAGVTLMEVLIAVTLLSLLTVGMAMAMRVGLNAFSKTDNRLMDNRPCGRSAARVGTGDRGYDAAGAALSWRRRRRAKSAFRPVSGRSPEDAPPGIHVLPPTGLARATALLLELFVIPGEEGRGVRLLVNELPYHHPSSRRKSARALAPIPPPPGSPVSSAAGGHRALFRTRRQTGLLPLQLLAASQGRPGSARHLAADPWPIRAGREPSASKWPRSNQTPQGCSPLR